MEITGAIDTSQAACETARAGVAAPVWAELYFQTAYDPTVAPRGAHTMSVFAQYAPYDVVGGWDARRDEIGDAVLNLVAQFAPDVGECVMEREVLGPPDVEARVGLTGGHIFQGECLPHQMCFGVCHTPVPSERFWRKPPTRWQRDRGQRTQRPPPATADHRTGGARLNRLIPADSTLRVFGRSRGFADPQANRGSEKTAPLGSSMGKPTLCHGGRVVQLPTHPHCLGPPPESS